VVLDRARGGSYLSVGLTGIAVFGVFLFLTYYLQQVKGYSPVTSGLAFLPMIACILLSSNTSSIVLLPRVGPRALIVTGMLSLEPFTIGKLVYAGGARVEAGGSPQLFQTGESWQNAPLVNYQHPHDLIMGLPPRERHGGLRAATPRRSDRWAKPSRGVVDLTESARVDRSPRIHDSGRGDASAAAPRSGVTPGPVRGGDGEGDLRGVPDRPDATVRPRVGKTPLGGVMSRTRFVTRGGPSLGL
jgi:hypothetical protein